MVSNRCRRCQGQIVKGFIVAYLPDGTLNDEPAFGANNVGKGKFGDVIYIPAVSTVDEHTKVSGPSALRDLLSDVLKGVVTSSASYQAFNDAFQQFRSSIKDDASTDGRSLKGLETEINQRIKSWGADFSLDLNPPDPAAIIKNNISHAFTDADHGHAQDATQFGSGFQRQFIYTLIEVAAEYAVKPAPKKKEFSPDLTLILFEEPEAFLHPTQQENLARKLLDIGKAGGRQVICSTHSAHFVTKHCDRLGSIVRVRRDQGKTRLFQVLPERWKQIVEDNQAINAALGQDGAPSDPSQAEQDVEDVRYFLWLDATRCGLFFANHVVLVEGATEFAFFGRLVSDRKLDVGEQGVFFLDTLGKYNTHRFMNLLSALGITHSAVLDDDNNNGKHQKLNQLVRDSRDDEFTYAIEFFDGDLEGVLQIEKAQRRDLKPQHVLVCYENDKISDDCLASMIEVLSKCLP